MAAYKTVLGRVKHQLQESTSSFISPLAGEILILEQNNRYRLYVGTNDDRGTIQPIDYITLDGTERITGEKIFVSNSASDPKIILSDINENNQLKLCPGGSFVMTKTVGGVETNYTLTLPAKTDTIATLSDIAGGVELVGTYNASSYNLEFELVPAH